MLTRLALFLGVLLTVIIAALLHYPAPIIADDLVQPRINQALAVLTAGVVVEQTFVPQHDNLNTVEVQIARYNDDPASGSLSLELFDSNSQAIAQQTFDIATLTHNQILSFAFPLQANSNGHRYTLRIVGTGSHPFSIWGYTVPTLLPAESSILTVTGTPTTAQVLRLTTRYELTGLSALGYIVQYVGQTGGYWLLAVAFMTLPGVLLLQLAHRRLPTMDIGAWWGVALAAGLSVWALLWYYVTLIGLAWNPLVLWGLVIVGWATIGVLAWRGKRPKVTRREWGTFAILLVIIFGGTALRLLAVRDLNIPPWVDAVRHALITDVMANKAQVLSDYRPLLPIDRFPYHFGFHTIPASLELMTGWELPTLMLTLGQWLNGLVALAVYSGAWLITRRRDASLVAAFLVALPLLFPAYYATWGRYTQLTGMLIMPPLAGLFILLIFGGRRWRQTWWLIGLLAAGLFLAHIRVFLYFAPLPFAAWIWQKGRNTRWLAMAGVLGGLAVLPRVLYLMPRPTSGSFGSVFLNNIPDYNAFPTGYFTTGWEQYFAGAALVAVLIVILANARQPRWTTPLLFLALWIGLLFGSLAGRRVGLPESWLVNLNSMVITLFFPQSIVIAGVAVRLWDWLKRLVTRYQPALRPVLTGVVAALFTIITLFGIRSQITVLNAQTILALPDDLPALEWVRDNTPQDATFAVNSWKWLGNTWSGSDGGAWIVPFTERQSLTPPADYEYSRDLITQVTDFNEQLATYTDWRDPAAVAWLKTQGVTHIFVGSKGGPFDPAALLQNPAVTLVHQHGGAFVFEVR